MIHHLRGKLVSLSPTAAVVECGGVGYELLISLFTYGNWSGKEEVLAYTHLVVREDAHVLYGFAGTDEREVFLALLGVSGVGASTARMVLSALDPGAARAAIASGDVGLLKGVKGIGVKTAQRIVVDLQDKIGAGSVDVPSGLFSGPRNKVREEALGALVSLGFDKNRCEKTVDQIISKSPEELPVEALIKQALKQL
ncbi:MAG: Holliday junction branch migration protein RuvA [Flavobacteriales bacterium]|jgi:Holliday junction DNA helicase RuvA